MKLFTGAVLVLVTMWAGGLVWNWRRRRNTKCEDLSPEWLNEHGARRWK